MNAQPGETEPIDVLAWFKAQRLMTEVALLDVTRTPGAVVHTSYYAMHHAARAVLVRLQGDGAPIKHIAVVSRFGLLAKNAGQHAAELMDVGHDLHTVYNARLRADYNLALITTPQIAAACLQKAHSFMVVCAERFGFAQP